MRDVPQEGGYFWPALTRCLQAAALLLCAAAAHGQRWVSLDGETTRSTIIVDSQAVKDGTRVSTDLAFARSASHLPTSVTVSVATDRLTVGQVFPCRFFYLYRVSSPFVDVRNSNHTDAVEANITNFLRSDPTLRFHIKASTDIPSGDFVFDLDVNLHTRELGTGAGCPTNPLTLRVNFTITVAAKWRALAADRQAAAKIFSYIRINEGSAAVPTGIAIQRDSDQCGYTSVSLINSPPAAFQLRKYSSAGVADGAAGSSFSGVAMGRNIDGEDDDDRHVKLEFKADATTQEGTYTVSIGLQPHASSCPGKENLVPRNGQTVAYEVTMSSRDQWDIHPTLDRIAQTAIFSPARHLRATQAAATGVRLHRNSVSCEEINVTLTTGTPAYFKLGLYNAAGARQGALADGFRAVPMKRDAADAADRHVRLLIDATALTIESTTVTVIVEPNSSCTGSSIPLKQDVPIPISIVEPAAWRPGLRHDFTAIGIFNEKDLVNKDFPPHRPEPTGMGFQASPDINQNDCAFVDVDMVNAPAFLNLIARQSDGRVVNSELNLPRFNHYNHPMRTYRTGSQTRQARPLDLVFPRDTGATGGVHTITIVARPADARSCKDRLNAPWTLTAIYTLTIRSFWRTFAGDSLSNKLLRGMAAEASVATDVGVRLHRGLSSCAKLDVKLVGNPPTYLKLRRYDGNGVPDGAAATSFTDLHAEEGSAASRHLRVLIDASTNIGANTLPVEVEFRHKRTCHPDTVPESPLTVSFNITISGGDSWRTLALDQAKVGSFDPAVVLAAAAPHDTGLRIHQATETCRSIDATLGSDAPAYVQLGVYRNDGTADSSFSPARGFTNVTMDNPEMPAANRHLRLLFQAGATVPLGARPITVTLAPSSRDCDFTGKAGSRRLEYALTMEAAWNTLAGHMLAPRATYIQSAKPNFRVYNNGDARIIPFQVLTFRKTPSASCQVVDLKLMGDNFSWPLGMRLISTTAVSVRFAQEDVPVQTTILVNQSLATSRIMFYPVQSLEQEYSDFTNSYEFILQAVSGTETGCPSPRITLHHHFVLSVAVRAGLASMEFGDKNEFSGAGDLNAETIKNSTVAVESGIVWHGRTRYCSVRARFAYGAPGWLQMRKYRPDDTPDGAAGRRFGYYFDRAMRVQIKPGATVEPGTVAFTIIGGVASGGGCTQEFAQPHAEGDQPPYSFRLTIKSQKEWLGLSQDKPRSRRFSGLDFRKPGAAIDTEVRFHRSAAVCRTVDVGLKAGSPSNAKLRLHRSDGTADGGFATSFTAVRMEDGVDADRHVRLYLDRYDTAQGRVAVTITAAAATGAGGCAGSDLQDELEVGYRLDIATPVSWVATSRDAAAPIGEFTEHGLSVAAAPVDTGIRLHRRAADACPNVSVGLRSGTPSYLQLQQYGTADRAKQGVPASSFSSLRVVANVAEASNRMVGLEFKAGSEVAAGTFAVTVDYEPAGCGHINRPLPASQVYRLTVSDKQPWLDQGRDRASAAGSFSAFRVGQAADGTDTGIVFHRGSSACMKADLALVNSPPAAVELVKYRSSDDARAVDASLSNVHMERGGSEDHHVRLFFKARAQVVPGVLTVSLRAAANPSCTASGTQDPITVAWRLTLAAAASWESQGKDEAEAAGSFSPLVLRAAGARTDTGLAFHRSSTACRQINVGLKAGAPDYLELARHRSSDDAPAAATGLDDIHMEEDDGADNYVRLFFKANAAVPAAGGVVLATVVGTPHGSCVDGATPQPVEVEWSLTVARPASWTTQDDDDEVADGPFSPLRIAASSSRTATGLAFHRSSAACRKINVALAAGAPAALELVRYDGNAALPAASLSSIHMEDGASGDNHVRLFFKAGATVAAGAEIATEVIGTPHGSCGDAATPGPVTVDWKLTVATPASWAVLASDSAAPARPFSPARLTAAAGRTDTGLAFHRSSAACRRINVSFTPALPGYLQALRYQGAVPASANSGSVADVPMDAGPAGASNQHVRLLFRERANVAAGTELTLTVVGTPHASCAGATTPGPVSVEWKLTLGTPAAWSALAADDAASSGPFSPLRIRSSSSRTDTGLAFHRSSAACRRIDVAIAGGAPGNLELVRHQGASPAEQTGLSDIPMTTGGQGAGNQHVRLYFTSGAQVAGGAEFTLTVVGTPNAGCLSGDAPGPVAVEWKLTVARTAQWQRLDEDAGTAPGLFSPLVIQSATSPTDTELAFHRSSSACRRIDVALAANAPGSVELARYRGASASPETGLANIRMEASRSDDDHVRLFFKAGAQVPGNSTLEVTLVATPNASCAAAPAAPGPLTVGWSLTTAETQGWNNQGLNSSAADGSFSPLRIAAAGGGTDTGIAFHQSSAACRRIAVALGAGAPDYVELRRYAGGSQAGSQALSDVTMDSGAGANDHHVRLFFKANANVAGGTEVTFSFSATPHASCSSNPATPAALTQEWRLTIAETADWEELARDDEETAGAFSPILLARAAGGTDSGLAFHRSSVPCRRIDVALAAGAPSYVELRRYAGSAPATDTALTAITMRTGSSGDHHVRLFFGANAAVSAGAEITINVVGTPNATCADARTPGPVTVTWELTVATPASWTELGAEDRVSDGPFGPALLAKATGRTDAGLAFQRNSAACSQVDVALAAGAPAYLSLARYRGGAPSPSAGLSDIKMAASGADSDHVRLFFAAGAAAPAGGGTIDVTVVATPNAGCADPRTPTALSVAWKLTVAAPAAWTAFSGDDGAAARVFETEVLLASAAATDTGLAFQRSSSACRTIDVSLARDEDVFELHRYEGSTRATAAGAARIAAVAITTASDSHVRVFFKAGARLGGGLREVALVAAPGGACAAPATPFPLTVAYELTLRAPVELAQWEDRGQASAAAARAFGTAELRGAAGGVDTGLRVHRGSAACSSTDVVLASQTEVFELFRYDGTTRAAGAGSARIDAVPMPAGGASHVRIFFKPGVDVAAATLAMQLAARANPSCTAPETPLPSNLRFAVTVAPPAAWDLHRKDSAEPTGAFDQLDLAEAAAPWFTGIQIHRSSSACAATDVALAAGAPAQLGLDVEGGGVALAASHARVPMRPGSGRSDRSVDLYFAAGAAVAPATVAVTVVLSPGCDDPLRPEPQTVSYQLTVNPPLPPVPWDLLAEDRLLPVAAGHAAIRRGARESGVRVHRSSAVCGITDVELLAGAEHLELGAYDAEGTADGPAAARLTDVRMKEGFPGDRHVRLLFKASPLPPAPGVTATLRIAPAAACTSRRNAPALTLSLALPVVDDFDDPPSIALSQASLVLSPGVADERYDTSLRIDARDDDDASVAVALNPAARATFALRAAGGGRHELHVNAGVTLEAGARFTIVFTATDDVGAAALTAAATLEARVSAGAEQAVATAVADAGGAAARVIGIGGIDAVMARPADGGAATGGGGEALLEMLAAKRDGLESGEIDLREFLDGQSFALPLGQNGGGAGGLGLWFQAESKEVGGLAGQVYTEGDVFSASLGVDARFSSLLVGAGFGAHKASAAYGTDDGGRERLGEYELDLRVVQPYAAFDVGGLRLAQAVGVGSGEIALRPEGADEEVRHDVDYLGYSVGAIQRLRPFGGGELSLRGSYAVGHMDVEESADGPSLDSESGALRLALAYAHAIGFAPGASISPFFEASYLGLDGDGDVGDSYILAGGLGYATPRLRASASYQRALGDEVTLDGFDLSFRFQPGAAGLGLGLEAAPGYGLAKDGRLFDELGAGRALELDAAAELRAAARLSYGLAVPGAVLTPYGRWTLQGADELGLRLQAGERRSWLLGYAAAAQELKIEYRLGD